MVTLCYHYHGYHDHDHDDGHDDHDDHGDHDDHDVFYSGSLVGGASLKPDFVAIVNATM